MNKKTIFYNQALPPPPKQKWLNLQNPILELSKNVYFYHNKGLSKIVNIEFVGGGG